MSATEFNPVHNMFCIFTACIEDIDLESAIEYHCIVTGYWCGVYGVMRSFDNEDPPGNIIGYKDICKMTHPFWKI